MIRLTFLAGSEINLALTGALSDATKNVATGPKTGVGGGMGGILLGSSANGVSAGPNTEAHATSAGGLNRSTSCDANNL